MSFDPYSAWLQIPRGQRPPDHYALLGLPPFSADDGQFGDSYRERYALVRKFVLGDHGEIAQRLIDELSTSHDCLTDPARKQEYDEELRRRETIGGGEPESDTVVEESRHAPRVARRPKRLPVARRWEPSPHEAATAAFDPYWEWLQIPVDLRPPDHYVLLGLPALEEDIECIRRRYRERFTLVRNQTLGKQGDDAQRLIDDLSEAYACLTNSEKKRA